MESASGVKSDAMPAAVDSANVPGYGELLLKAIDWAMTPEETKRPQSVTEFRKALDSAVDTTTVVNSPPEGLRTQQGASGGSAASSGLSASQSASHPDSLRRNVMGTIMFLDLVGYSQHSVSQQVLLKTSFNELLNAVAQHLDRHE